VNQFIINGQLLSVPYRAVRNYLVQFAWVIGFEIETKQHGFLENCILNICDSLFAQYEVPYVDSKNSNKESSKFMKL